eukprot:14458400-Alexandrium_andersonii.AAC.1
MVDALVHAGGRAPQDPPRYGRGVSGRGGLTQHPKCSEEAQGRRKGSDNHLYAQGQFPHGRLHGCPLHRRLEVDGRCSRGKQDRRPALRRRRAACL